RYQQQHYNCQRDHADPPPHTSATRNHSLFHTMPPPVTVATGPPVKRRPLKGELRLFDCDCRTSNVHSLARSNTVTSPGAPVFSVPRSRCSTFAGPVVNNSTIRPTEMRPGCTSSES